MEPKKLKKPKGIAEFLEKKFPTFEFTEHWLQMFGEPEKNFRMLIKGREKNGKTTWTLFFTKYLSQFGKVYYNSHEEGISKTLQNAMQACNMLEVAGKVMILHKESVEDLEQRLEASGSPRFVVLDSADYMKLTEDQYKKLIHKFPNKSFIIISWSDTKDEPLSAHAKRIAKRVDIVVTIKNYTVYAKSRFLTEDSPQQQPHKFDRKGKHTPVTTIQPQQTLFA